MKEPVGPMHPSVFGITLVVVASKVLQTILRFCRRSVCRETCRRHKPLPRIVFFNIPRLLEENMTILERINFSKFQTYFTGAPHIVFNSVCFIDTNYIYVLSRRTEKVQKLCKLEGLSDLPKRFANGSS